jgi:hypothetical protein
MKTSRRPFLPAPSLLLLALLPFGLAGARCAEPAPLPSAAAPAPASQEVTLTGLLYHRLAIGGETTGWVLRYGQDQKQTIELLLKITDFDRLTEGMAVVVRGTYVTRTYPERGEVRMFAVRDLSEVMTSR